MNSMFQRTNLNLFLSFFLIKLAMAWGLAFLSNCMSPDFMVSSWAVNAGDTFSYFQPFQNLHDHGTFFFRNEIGEQVFAGRMPVYGLLYYLLYPSLGFETIATLYVWIQVLMESLACLLLFKMTRKKFSTDRLPSLLFFVILGLSTFHTFWSIKLIPESIGLSTLVIIMYLAFQQRENDQILKWCVLGILLAILVGLKPYMGILLLPLSIDILVRNRMNLKRILLSWTALSIPLIILLVAWGNRNHTQIGKFIPLTQELSGYFIPESHQSLRKYLAIQGESAEYWDKKAQSSYYFGRESVYEVEDLHSDSYITQDSIQFIRAYFSRLSAESFDLKTDQSIARSIERFTSHYENMHPFAELYSTLKIAKGFLFHSGSYYLPISKSSPCYSSWQWLFKLMQSGFYYLVLCLGFIGFFFWKDWLLWFIPIFLLILFCVIIKNNELRFFLYAYPGLLLGLFASNDKMLSLWKR